MKQQPLQIIVAFLALSIFSSSCRVDGLLNKYPGAKISKTEDGNTLIVTEEFSAIILTREFLEERAPWVPPVPPSGYWTPKVDQVLTLESKLEEFVAKNGSRFNSGYAPSKEDLSTYGRQYIGITNPDGSYIVGIFFCSHFSKDFDWKNQAVSVMGGGDCFFGVWYDPDKQEFIVLGVNSPK